MEVKGSGFENSPRQLQCVDPVALQIPQPHHYKEKNSKRVAWVLALACIGALGDL